MVFSRRTLAAVMLLSCVIFAGRGPARSRSAPSRTAPAWAPVRWSTLFTAQDVQHYLTTAAGRRRALAWCRRMGIRQVYLEIFRDGDQVNAAMLRQARTFFLRNGIAADGMVATTELGKPSTGWKIVACYTNAGNQRRLRQIFREGASIFPRILIDDFFFTDCTCSECAAARGNLSWAKYRRQLMLKVSQRDVLAPAHAVNPHVQVVIKFPQWYDQFQNRGYRVASESRLFDGTWIGTETRDPRSVKWDEVQQYRGSLLPGWVRRISGRKLGGGWFDPYGTTPPLYLDQAYQTVLARLPEILLFHYGDLVRPRYRPQARALRLAMPALARLDREIGAAQFLELPAYKPVSSGNDGEPYIYDNFGMLGIPLAMTPRFPQMARMAVFATYGLRDPRFVPELKAFLAAGHTAILTSRLARELAGDPRLPGFRRLLRAAPGPVTTLRARVPGSLNGASMIPLALPRAQAFAGGQVVIVRDADLLAARLAPNAGPALPQPLPAPAAALRRLALADFNLASNAPLRVALYPARRFIVADNFNDRPAAFRVRRGDETLRLIVPAHTATLRRWPK